MPHKKTSLTTPNIVLAGLTLATSAIATVMAYHGLASWLEAVSFVTGALCVWLTVRENVLNFPLGILNVATFSIVFFRAGLYADASLQVVYFILGLIGWYLWLFGGERHTALRVARASRNEILILIGAATLLCLALWQLLHHVGGSASFWDALTTSFSLVAQWLLNRKRLENWLFWIVVDIIYVPLYLYKSLYLTSLLYAVFLVMACIGLHQWLKTYRAQTAPAPALAEVPA